MSHAKPEAKARPALRKAKHKRKPGDSELEIDEEEADATTLGVRIPS